MSGVVHTRMNGGKVRFDELLNALADSYRRELLLSLLNHNPQDDDDSDPLDIHDSDFVEESQFDIFMYHLPMLDQLGIIEWERESEEIVKGPDWDEFAPLLKLIANHKDELPAGWFEKPEETDTPAEVFQT
jgi:hypothetical protein